MDQGDIGRRRIADTLRTSPVFAEVDATAVDALAAEMGEVRLSDGQTLFQDGDIADAMYLVLSGALHVLAPDKGSRGSNELPASRRMGRVMPGDPVGEMALLVGGYRSATVRAVGTTLLGRLPASTFEQAVSKAPQLRTALEREITRRMRHNRIAGLIRQYFGTLEDGLFQALEDSFHWLPLNPGEVLFDRGDPGDSLFILVSGQLRVLAGDDKSGYQAMATIRPGELVGEMAVLRDKPRSARVVASHACTLLRLSRVDFEHLSRRHPALSLAMTRQVVDRLERAQQQTSRSDRPRTIAVIKASRNSAPRAFLSQLEKSLASHTRSLVLTPSEIGRRLGRDSIAHAGPGDPAHMGLGMWLEQQEAEHGLVFYVTEPLGSSRQPSGWTRRCLERADEILVLADSRDQPEPEGLEANLYRYLEQRRETGVAPRVHLLLLHPEDTELPRGTARWLGPRQVDVHHHVRMGDRLHLERLARRLTGRAIGVAFSGGGARGIAHIGVLRALEEAGVPVDMVTGTSMGGVIGALYARGMPASDILAQAEWSFVKSDPWREYTLPTYSLLRSRRLDHVSHKTYGDIQVEDLWRSFACVSTNISRQQATIHDHGPLWRAVRATGAIPGLVTPVIIEGEIHVDGGVLNNLPGDLLRTEVARLIAIDVRAPRGLTARRPDFPSPWASLWRRKRNRQARAEREVPNIMDILMDSVLAASDQAATRTLAEADIVFAPPLGNTTTLQFRNLKGIEQMGYDYARGIIDALGVETLCSTPAPRHAAE